MADPTEHEVGARVADLGAIEEGPKVSGGRVLAALPKTGREARRKLPPSLSYLSASVRIAKTAV